MSYEGTVATALVNARAIAGDGEVLPAIDAGANTAGVSGFSGGFMQALQRVDAQSREADERMAAVDSGRSDDLVGAMLASQEASLSFSMLMQVRNKVVGAMDELIKLQL